MCSGQWTAGRWSSDGRFLLLGDAHGAVTAVPLRVGSLPLSADNHANGIDDSAHASSSGLVSGGAGAGESSEDAERPAWMPEDFEWYAFCLCAVQNRNYFS